jgi:hypothetical protein
MSMTTEASAEAAKKPPDNDKKIRIKIDRKPYSVKKEKLTGAEIRALPDPDIGAEFDLWLEVPGGEDRKIEAGEEVKLKDGMHFFTAPSHINPGSPC